jgi:hypothetical protein
MHRILLVSVDDHLHLAFAFVLGWHHGVVLSVTNVRSEYGSE